MTTPSKPIPSPTTALTDVKEGLAGGRKPDTTHVRRAFMIYTSRPCEYGSVKYVRGNYRRPTGGVAHAVPTAEDFIRFRNYLRAAGDHIQEVLDMMELHLATDPDLLDIEGMKRAAYAVDTDVTPGSKVGASLLPHVAPACASLNMAITQATDCGLLPRDPGTPWVTAQHAQDTTAPAATACELALSDEGRAALDDLIMRFRTGADAPTYGAGHVDVPLDDIDELDREIAHGFGDVAHVSDDPSSKI